MQLQQVLFSQGFGTRRECVALVRHGRVSVAGRVVDDPAAEVDTAGLTFEVDGEPWPYHAKALVLLHKPAGTECSRAPRHHPGVLSLLPPPLRTRGVQPVGRLDEDTTGVLLLSDDGALLHRLTSPKHHVPKVYEVQARHPVTPEQIARLVAGVRLADDPRPVRAVAAVARGERLVELTLDEGRYHQVKRMLAAVGNRVEALHRSAFGPVVLPAGLDPGQWCWLDRAALGPPFMEQAPVTSPAPAPQQPPSAAAHVLVVEDNPVSALVVLEFLAGLGVATTHVLDGIEALDALASGRFDVVLMDMQMPRLDGLEATRRWREQEAAAAAARRVPIIAVTANAADGDRERCLAAGMDDYVAKPIDPRALRALIAPYLRGPRS